MPPRQRKQYAPALRRALARTPSHVDGVSSNQQALVENKENLFIAETTSESDFLAWVKDEAFTSLDMVADGRYAISVGFMDKFNEMLNMVFASNLELATEL